MKTVTCLSFIVLNNFLRHVSGPLLGGEKGGGAPQNKTPPPKLPSILTQTFATLAAVSKWLLFFCGNQPRPRRKVDHIGAMTFFFLDINRELGEN